MTKPDEPRLRARYWALVLGVVTSAACAATPSWTISDAVIMLVPPEVPNPTLDQGCWIRLSDGVNFTGQSFVVVGPAELRASDLAAIVRFRRRVSSAETGRKAMAQLYSRENFAGTVLSMGPSDTQAQLGHAFGSPHGRVQALRLSCQE